MASSGIYKGKGNARYFVAVCGKGYRAYLGNNPITGIVTKEKARKAIIEHRREAK
jgi:hypothetical protein